MRLEPTAGETEFRQVVRNFVLTELPASTRDKVRHERRLNRDDLTSWYQLLNAQSWATPRWPVEWGGTGWTEAQHAIFDEELQLNDAPRMVSPGIMMLGPTLIRYGSAEQQMTHLPSIRSSDVWWAQGFSESEAGSDLAAIRTTAKVQTDVQGTHYVVSGTKLWTSYAHFCDMMFCLVRTNISAARRQHGLSLLLLSLSSPGVSIRRLRTLDGGDDLNEVILDGVRVPEANRVGAEGDGWTYAKYLLSFERGGIAGVGAAKKLLKRLRDLSRDQATSHPVSRGLESAIERLALEVLALEATANRLLSQDPIQAITPSILKVRGTELRQELANLIYQHSASGDVYERHAEIAPGMRGAGLSANPANTLLGSRKLSIYGGTNEVQRNIIAKHAFGDWA